MDLNPFDWRARLLLSLMRDGDGHALLGDLTEEYARRSRAGSASEAARWCRHQLHASLAAVVWRRVVDGVRTMPWGTAAAAYLIVAAFEYGAVRLLALLWPGTAYETSVLRLVVEFPGIVAIAYVAAQFRRSAAFVLGGVMLVMAVVMVIFSLEAISAAFAIATLTLGPLAALAGGLLHRRWTAV